MLYVLLPRRQRYTNQCLFSPRQVSPTRWRQEREDRRKEITTYLSDLSSFPPPPLLLSEQRKEALITLGREEEIDERAEEGVGKTERLFLSRIALWLLAFILSLSLSLSLSRDIVTCPPRMHECNMGLRDRCPLSVPACFPPRFSCHS